MKIISDEVKNVEVNSVGAKESEDSIETKLDVFVEIKDEIIDDDDDTCSMEEINVAPVILKESEIQKEIEDKITPSSIAVESKVDDQIIFTPKISEDNAIVEKKEDNIVVNTETVDDASIEVKPEKTRTRKPRVYESTQNTRVINYLSFSISF